MTKRGRTTPMLVLVTHYLCGQGDFAWEVRSSQAEGRLTLGLAGPGPEYLSAFY